MTKSSSASVKRLDKILPFVSSKRSSRSGSWSCRSRWDHAFPSLCRDGWYGGVDVRKETQGRTGKQEGEAADTRESQAGCVFTRVPKIKKAILYATKLRRSTWARSRRRGIRPPIMPKPGAGAGACPEKGWSGGGRRMESERGRSGFSRRDSHRRSLTMPASNYGIWLSLYPTMRPLEALVMPEKRKSWTRGRLKAELLLVLSGGIRSGWWTRFTPKPTTSKGIKNASAIQVRQQGLFVAQE